MTSNDTGCARYNSSVQISYCFTDPEMTEVSDQVRMESQPSPRVPGSRGPSLRHYPPSSNPGRVLTAAGGGTGLATGAGSKALSSPHRLPPHPAPASPAWTPVFRARDCQQSHRPRGKWLPVMLRHNATAWAPAATSPSHLRPLHLSWRTHISPSSLVPPSLGTIEIFYSSDIWLQPC